MEIYLIRHTRPRIDTGICYGQSDIDVCGSFEEEASSIKKVLPDHIMEAYSSPLLRCKKLAHYLFPDQEVSYRDDLKEINCGDWELKKWNDINERQLKEWMSDFVHIPFPGGENFVRFHKRVIDAFDNILLGSAPLTAHITHAGVIQSILAHITGTPLKSVFAEFKLAYGTIVVLRKANGSIGYEILK